MLGQNLWWLAVMGLAGAVLLVFNLWLVSRRQELSVAGELAGIVGLALGAPMAYYSVVPARLFQHRLLALHAAGSAWP